MENEIEYRINRGKKEILEAMEEGLIPKDIKSFYDIDDYADANYFCGFCEADYKISENFVVEGIVQEAINEWLETR